MIILIIVVAVVLLAVSSRSGLLVLRVGANLPLTCVSLIALPPLRSSHDDNDALALFFGTFPFCLFASRRPYAAHSSARDVPHPLPFTHHPL